MIKRKLAWREAAWIFGASRLLLLLVSLLVSVLGARYMPIFRTYVFVVAPKTVVQGCSALSCFEIWWREDAVRIVDIAHNGYANPLNTAFFPLFPLLMHALGALFGGSTTADYAAGVILSNIFFYFSLVLLYQLVRDNYDATIARKTLVLLSITPYAINFFAGYTESLSLFLILATFLFLQRGGPRDWWLAGLCGLLATLTRSPNLALVVPFLLIFVQKFGLHTLFSPENWRQKLNAILPIALVPAGLLIYMFYLWRTFGNPLMFSTAEAVGWYRYTTFPWVGIIDAFRALFVFNRSIMLRNLSQLFLTLVPLSALIISWKRLPLRYSLFALAMILFCLANPSKPYPYGALSAAPRFMSLVFPIFIIFAHWSKRPLVYRLLIAVSLIGFIANTLVFEGTY